MMETKLVKIHRSLKENNQLHKIAMMIAQGKEETVSFTKRLHSLPIGNQGWIGRLEEKVLYGKGLYLSQRAKRLAELGFKVHLESQLGLFWTRGFFNGLETHQLPGI